MKPKEIFKERMGRISLVLPILLLVTLISGCAVTTSPSLTEAASVNAGSPGSGAVIRGVPFYPQKRYMCGPSAIRSVLNYYGLNVDEAEAVEAVYSEKIKGSLVMDLFILAKSKGFNARFYSGSITDLKAHIRNGTPLLLLVDMGLKWMPMGHYIVAVGYDDEQDALIAHSGEEEHKVIPFKSFKKAWQKTGYSTLLVTPAALKE